MLFSATKGVVACVVLNAPGAASSVRLIPDGVMSSAQAKITATGNPRTSAMMTSRTAQLGDFEERKNLSRDLNQNPRDHDVGDRDAINLAPLQPRRKSSSVPRGGNARSGAVGPQGAYDVSSGKRQVRPEARLFRKKWICHAFAFPVTLQDCEGSPWNFAGWRGVFSDNPLDRNRGLRTRG